MIVVVFDYSLTSDYQRLNSIVGKRALKPVLFGYRKGEQGVPRMHMQLVDDHFTALLPTHGLPYAATGSGAPVTPFCKPDRDIATGKCGPMLPMQICHARFTVPRLPHKTSVSINDDDDEVHRATMCQCSRRIVVCVMALPEMLRPANCAGLQGCSRSN